MTLGNSHQLPLGLGVLPRKVGTWNLQGRCEDPRRDVPQGLPSVAGHSWANDPGPRKEGLLRRAMHPPLPFIRQRSEEPVCIRDAAQSVLTCRHDGLSPPPTPPPTLIPGQRCCAKSHGGRQATSEPSRSRPCPTAPGRPGSAYPRGP